VIELTYNYGVKHYQLGNDFLKITINSKEVFEKLKSSGKGEEKNGSILIASPDGYHFQINNADPENDDPVDSVSLHVSNLDKSLDYWYKLLGMKMDGEIIESKQEKRARLYFEKNQAQLELIEKFANEGKPIDHAEGYGRIAFSCPAKQLKQIQDKMEDKKQIILTPLISLDTPGKATVQVVILADPDGYEICFVGDEAFKELSQVDEKALELLQEAMKQDDSVEYYARKKRLNNQD